MSRARDLSDYVSTGVSAAEFDHLDGVTSGIQTQMDGLETAKAWVSYDQTTPAIDDSFNVSTVDDDATGEFTVNFTSAMTNANYTIAGMTEDHSYLQIDEGTRPTTSAFKLRNTHNNNVSYDREDNMAIVFGD
jgi:hypothetical protein